MTTATLTRITQPEEPLDQVGFIRKSVKENSASFHKRRLHNRRVAFFIRMMVVALGSLATVLLGIKTYAAFKPWDQMFSAMALMITASIPVLSAWESFFDHRWLWVRYSTTLGLLYAISDELEFSVAENCGNPPPKEKLEQLFARLQFALGDTNTDWSAKRLRDNEGQEKGVG